LSLDDSSVYDKMIMGVGRDDPVQSPFKHGKSLIHWQWLERNSPITIQTNLRPENPPQQIRVSKLNFEVDKSIGG